MLERNNLETKKECKIILFISRVLHQHLILGICFVCKSLYLCKSSVDLWIQTEDQSTATKSSKYWNSACFVSQIGSQTGFFHMSVDICVWITRRKRSKRVVMRKKRGSREEVRRGRWCEDCEEERQGEELLSWLSCLINGTWCWAVPLCSVNQSSSLYVSPLLSSVLFCSRVVFFSPPLSSFLLSSQTKSSSVLPSDCSVLLCVGGSPVTALWSV